MILQQVVSMLSRVLKNQLLNEYCQVWVLACLMSPGCVVFPVQMPVGCIAARDYQRLVHSAVVLNNKVNRRVRAARARASHGPHRHAAQSPRGAIGSADDASAVAVIRPGAPIN